MSNRGNQDYYKVSGTPTQMADIARMARQSFTRERAREHRAENPKKGRGPEAVPLNLTPPEYLEHPAHTEPPSAPPIVEEPAMPARGWSPPTVRELAWAGARGAFHLATRVGAIAYGYGRRSVSRRMARLVDRGERELGRLLHRATSER